MKSWISLVAMSASAVLAMTGNAEARFRHHGCGGHVVSHGCHGGGGCHGYVGGCSGYASGGCATGGCAAYNNGGYAIAGNACNGQSCGGYTFASYPINGGFINGQPIQNNIIAPSNQNYSQPTNNLPMPNTSGYQGQQFQPGTILIVDNNGQPRPAPMELQQKIKQEQIQAPKQ